MNKIGIGIVGLGPIAQNAHLPAIEKARDIHLQAIADTDAALRDQVQLRYRPETVHKHSDDLFADPSVDLVILAVSDGLHVPLAIPRLAGFGTSEPRPIRERVSAASPDISSRPR